MCEAIISPKALQSLKLSLPQGTTSKLPPANVGAVSRVPDVPDVPPDTRGLPTEAERTPPLRALASESTRDRPPSRNCALHRISQVRTSLPHTLCYWVTKWCHVTLASISDIWVKNLSYWLRFESYTWDLAQSPRKMRTCGRQRWATHTQNYPLVHIRLCFSTFSLL